MTTSDRGFASMDPERQRQIASMGGKHQGQKNNPGNFARDREKARRAGKKGGEAVSRDRQHMAAIGSMGGRG